MQSRSNPGVSIFFISPPRLPHLLIYFVCSFVSSFARSLARLLACVVQVTWAQIKTAMGQPRREPDVKGTAVIQKVIEGKFLEPKMAPLEITAYFSGIADEIKLAFQNFTDGL